jgi:hypothetical protein
VSDYFNFLATDPAVPSPALNVIPQTFSILTRALPAEISTDTGLDQMDPLVNIPPEGQCAIILNPFTQTAKLHLDQPISQLNILIARFHRIIVSSLDNVLQKCIPGTSTLTAAMRRNCLRMCLEGLFHFAEEYPQLYPLLDASKPFPSYLPSTFVVAIANMSPEVIHLIQTDQDLDSRVVWRCFCALVVMKLVDGVGSRTKSNVQISNDELAWLSASLGIQSDDVKFCLERPGAVELAIIVTLAFGDVALSLYDSNT